ncbi:MAG: histidinol-phosphate transaminase [Anaerovoracaceae bacterium]|nr:histidinol-phosphate transaminase [Anaerovoracaceae bacterium]
MSRFLNENMSGLTPYTPGEQPKSRENIIKLNTNENPYGPSPKALKAIHETDEEMLILYPDPDATELTKSIAAACGVRPEQVMAGNGSDETLAFVFMGFGNHIYFPEISYGFYSVFASVFGCQFHAVPLKDDLSLDLDAFKGVDGTVVIANPNAPTGLAVSRDEIEELLKANRDHLVVIDEAYVDFGAESAAPLIDRYDNLMISRTTSKSLGLAGLRVGWCMACKEVIDDMKKIKFSFNPYNIDRVAMAAAKEALDDREHFADTCGRIMKTRGRTERELEELGFRSTHSMTNFIFVEHEKMPGDVYFRKLRERNILVRHFDTEKIKNYVRITIGTDEQMDRLISETKEILKEI